MSLRGRAQFRRVLSAGTRARAGVVTAIVAPGSDPTGVARLGLGVRLSDGGAVVRNKVRRRLREAFAATGAAGCDVVLRADERVLGVEFQKLVTMVDAAVRSAGDAT